MKILERLNPDNTVSFSRPLAHSLGLNAAVVYSALISKMAYYSGRGMLGGEGWFYSTVADLQESTSLSKRQQCTAVKTLTEAGLIECKKDGMPARRYFRICDDIELLDSFLQQGSAVMTELNPIAQKSRNAPACESESAPQDVPKCAGQSEQNAPYTYNPNINNPEYINPYPSITHDGNDEVDNTPVFVSSDERSEQLDLIRYNIGYDCFQNKSEVDQLVDIMLDVVCSGKSTIRVNGENMPKEVVKSRYLKLDSDHIAYVLQSLKKNSSEVRNIRSYIITALYNAPETIDSFYSSLVNREVFGGG